MNRDELFGPLFGPRHCLDPWGLSILSLTPSPTVGRCTFMLSPEPALGTGCRAMAPLMRLKAATLLLLRGMGHPLMVEVGVQG